MHRYSSSLGKRPPISCELDLADPATKVPRVRFVDRSHVTVQCNRFALGSEPAACFPQSGPQTQSRVVKSPWVVGQLKFWRRVRRALEVFGLEAILLADRREVVGTRQPSCELLQGTLATGALSISSIPSMHCQGRNRTR